MAEFLKPDLINVVWCESGDKIAPDIAKYVTGWLVEIPPRQYFNYIDYKQDQFIAYMNQHGIPEWDAVTEYQANKSFIQHGGLLYKAIRVSINKQPDTNSLDWEEVVPAIKDASETEKGITQYATNAETQAGVIDTKSITPKGLFSVMSSGIARLATFAELTAKTEDEGPFVCTDMGGYLYTWQVSAFFAGYRSLVCGNLPQNMAKNPRLWEMPVIGATWSTTNERQKRLIAWFREQELVCDIADWIVGQGMIADLGAGSWKSPDLRNMFLRVEGTDVDTANAAGVGAYKGDTIKSHVHGVHNTVSYGYFNGATTNLVWFGGDGNSSPTGTAETAPMHTRTAAAILV